MVSLFGCRNTVPGTPATTADAAMDNAISAISENDPSGIWHMLPASSQQGLNETLHTFAAKMDAEIWEAVIALLTKGETVLRAKRALVLSLPDVQGNEVIVDQYDRVLELLHAVTQSELADLNQLKTADIGKILSSTGADIMEEASGLELPGAAGELIRILQDVQDFEAELVSASGDEATVMMTHGERIGEIECVRLEGKWLPRDVATDLPGLIKAAQHAVNGIDFTQAEMAATKSRALAVLGMADGILDQLDAAETDEDVQAVVQEVLRLAGMTSKLHHPQTITAATRMADGVWGFRQPD